MRKISILAVSVAFVLAGPASAQSNVEGRVGKLESEMRAVQRKVFPAGAGTLQPDIVAPTPAREIDGVPATSAIADLTTRVSALERQLASMTDQIEQNGYKTRQLQEQFDAYRKSNDARMKSLTAGPAPIAGSTAARDDTPVRAPGKPVTAAATSAVAAAAPTNVAGVDKPATGDTPEDEYVYGYRLWAAKKYPEAEAQLKKVVATYPKHKRASYAQNLLGRAYLDDGKPSLASMAFYDNYKKMPDGERAPESLYYLAQALMKLNKPADACKVYGELTDVYGSKISSGMQADVAKGRTAAKCS